MKLCHIFLCIYLWELSNNSDIGFVQKNVCFHMNTKELEVFYKPLFTRTQGLRLELIGSFMDFK